MIKKLRITSILYMSERVSGSKSGRDKYSKSTQRYQTKESITNRSDS